MIKVEEVPTTKILNKIYCDECGKYITSSIQYDDGYFNNPAEFSYQIFGYTFEKDLCEECKDKFYIKLSDALLKLGFKS